MTKRDYHYLVAGLADLTFDSGKAPSEMSEFREQLQEMLHPEDYNLVSILFLPYDNLNLVTFLEGNNDPLDPLGNFTAHDFEEEKANLFATKGQNNKFPEYLTNVITFWLGSEKSPDKMELIKMLTEGYISMALDSGNSFLKKWIAFDRDLNNIFSLINSKSLKQQSGNFIMGRDPFAAELTEIFERDKDFTLPSEPEYAPEIFKIATETEFLERERRTDIARWEYVDSLTFFEYFTIDKILGHLVKLSIVLRWKQLEPETGEKMLQRLIEEMEAPILSGDINRGLLLPGEKVEAGQQMN